MDQRTKRTLGWIVAAAAVAAIVVIIVIYAGGGEPPPQGPGQQPTTQPGPEVVGPVTRPGPKHHVEPPATKPAPQVPPLNPEIGKEEAERLFKDGLKRSNDGKFVEARTVLSGALFSGKLSAADAERARQELWQLAQTTIFSRHTFSDDPYAFIYEFEPGDTLADKRRGGKPVPGLVTALKLRVPAKAIELANETPATKFQAGKKYKLIRGPFHATVYRSIFAMDVYLQHEGGPKTFVRRLKVGLGKNGSTPLGSWLVKSKAGGKGTRATWYPPWSTGLVGPIEYGQKDYPFGEKGLWIKMEGLDANTRNAEGYGIHSTGDPSSIGRQTSLGCIRLADGDIDFVFNHLYEEHSTVWVRP